MNYQPGNARQLLTDLGVGNFNATLMIETLMMAPATTEAGSSPVMLLVQHIQQVLQQMGAPVAAQGIIDAPTDLALKQIAGDKWLYRTWFDVVRLVVAAKKKGMRVVGIANAPPAPPRTNALGFIDLPDVPGGMVTYGVGVYLIYRLLKNRRK